jgi:hypothetical protein
MKEYVQKLDGYIETLKKGEALPLPMGEYYRPAQKKAGEGEGGDAKKEAPPASGDAKKDGK